MTFETMKEWIVLLPYQKANRLIMLTTLATSGILRKWRALEEVNDIDTEAALTGSEY